MYNYYTQCIILHTVYNFTFSDNFELLGVTLRCFVARQLLSRIYALLSVKFPGLKLRLCKKNDKYQVCLPIKYTFVTGSFLSYQMGEQGPFLSYAILNK